MGREGIDIKIRSAVENDAALKDLREQEATLKQVANAAKRAGMDTKKLEAETASLGKAAARRELQVQIDALEKMANRSRLAGKENEHLAKSLAALRSAAATPPALPKMPPALPGRPGMMGGSGREVLSQIPGVGGYMGLGVAGGAAAAGMATVAVIGTLTRTMIDGTRAAADFAGEMSDLSAQTGETAEDAIILGQAFKNAGLNGMVGQSLNLLQKALAGVNEEGQPTAGVFKRLGLSIDDLKNMRATEQIENISAAIAKLRTPADQSKAAMELFGRSGGRMLALLKDGSAIETARTQVGGLAENIGVAAEDLDKFSDAIGALDLQQIKFFAGFAKGISGDLADAAKALNKMDFSKAGESLGLMARGASDLAKDLEKVLAILPRLPGQGPATIGGIASGVAKAGARATFDGVVPGGFWIRQFAGYLENRGSESLERDAQLKQKAPASRRGGSFDLAAIRQKSIGPEYGPGGDLEAIAKAAELQNEREELEKQNAERRSSLDLQLQLSEAQATGNKAAEKNLKWMIDYNRLLKEANDAGMGDGAYSYAIRGANAGAGEKSSVPDWKTPMANFSSMSRLGMAVGETSGAATIGAMLAQQLAEQRKVNDATLKSERHLNVIKDRVGKAKYG